MEQYEKIRQVGKGAFGVAVLCRKLKTNQLVVLKEINMNDLAPNEKQLAQNEVAVLSMLNHQNIISYGGSFQYQGNLIIEMEYADGGTLAQMLAKKEAHFPERQILSLVQQISSALQHMHQNKILHRDLKTANVFMTSDGTVKIGDFGISKVLSTNVPAQTVLGTPYYLSPEMCEGKDYDVKSDIWALGCILYELCCLHKTFQASTLPALVNKIMKAEYKPIPPGYSEKLNILLKDLLNKDPKKRPSADDLLDKRIPEVILGLGDKGNVYAEPELDFSTLRMEKSCGSVENSPFERSIVYRVKSFESDINVTPIQIPPKMKIKHMSVGADHFIAVSADYIVMSWGSGAHGQLGCGAAPTYRQQPLDVEYLRGKNIIMSSAGDEFSIFLSEHGTLYSCGNGLKGSLGHGDWNNCSTPKLIESLVGVKISYVSSGSHHTAALSDGGQIYTWGGGSKGQLGVNKVCDINVPSAVIIPFGLFVTMVSCGGESTMVVTSRETAMACGHNRSNKLALDGKMDSYNNITDYAMSLREISISENVLSCFVGDKHCVVYTRSQNGKTALYTTGHPFHRPTSDMDKRYSPERVRLLDNIQLMMISCGPTYTVVGTEDNCILIWGTRYGLRENIKMNSQQSSGVWSQKESCGVPSDDSSKTLGIKLASNYLSETITKPTPLLALYSSSSQQSSGRFLYLAGLYPLAYSIMVHINTTTLLMNDGEASQNNYDMQLEDCDSVGPIPHWMKSEVQQSQFTWSEK